MTQELDQLLQKTKGNLFFQKGAGFLGSLLCKVNVQWDSSFPTAAINPDTLFWNPEFFFSIDKDTRVTVLAHELWHNGLLHGIRLGDRCPDVWNQACDYYINLMLKKHGYYMGGFPFLLDKKYDGLSADEIYDLLQKKGGGQQSGYKLAGDILPTPVKDHAKAVAAAVSAITTARMTGQAGDVPGEIELLLDKYLNPKLPWEVLLRNYFNEMTNEEYSFTRPNRRYEDPILPGQTGRNGLEHLMYFMDISGSITDNQIFRFNSEVKCVWEDLKPEKLTMLTFDTHIRNTKVLEAGEDFGEIKVTGRGGTCLKKVFELIKKERPSAAIIFTDMEVAIPPDPGVPILWICIDNQSMKAPYGTMIHIKD